jgi:hypothetical protein
MKIPRASESGPVIRLQIYAWFWLTVLCGTANAQVGLEINLPNYRTPKQTLITYLRAIKNNDVAGARKCWWINDPEQTRILDILAERPIAVHQLNEIMRTKFPAEDREKVWIDDGVTKEGINRTIARLERSYTDVKGDCATMRIRLKEGDEPAFFSGSSRPVAKFRRVGSDWRLDANWEIGFQRPADFWVPQSWFYDSPRDVTVHRKLIDDLKNGRLRTVEEFNKARDAEWKASGERDATERKKRPLDAREECFFAAWRISVRYDREFYNGRGSLSGLFQWSERLLHAELARCRNEVERRAAADAHLERIEKVNYEIKQRAQAGRVNEESYFAADVYLASAQIARAKVHGKSSDPTDPSRPALTQLTASRLAYEDACESVRERSRFPLSSAAYWSSWWLSSAQAVATDKAEELAAAEEFRRRAETLEEIAKKEVEYVGIQEVKVATLNRARGEFLVRKLRRERGDKDADVDEAARARLKAAQAAFEGAWEIFRGGRGYFMDIYDLSTHWRTAAEWLAKSPAEKVGVAEAHLARMKQLQAPIRESHDAGRVPSFEFWATEFFVAEAELFVTEARHPERRKGHPGGGEP